MPPQSSRGTSEFATVARLNAGHIEQFGLQKQDNNWLKDSGAARLNIGSQQAPNRMQMQPIR
jgi:hypothetical protein